MKCQLSICTVPFLCGRLDTLFPMGKTRPEPRDMSYAVINAIMKMKIAVVATGRRQWEACEPKEEEDSSLGDRARRLCGPPRPLCGARQCVFQEAASLEQICFTAAFALCILLQTTASFFSGWHNFPFCFQIKGEGSASLTILPEWFICGSLKNSSFESVRLLRWRSPCRGDAS